MKQSARALFAFSAILLVVLCTAMLLTPLGARAASVRQQHMSQHTPHVFMKKGIQPRKSQNASTNNNLISHGGPVMGGTVNVYAIFWEPSNNVAPGYNSLILRYFGDVGSSSLYQVANQYTQQSSFPLSTQVFPSNAHLASSWVDTNAYPRNPLLDLDMQQEVARAQQINGWQSSIDNLFVVFTERNQNVCADNTMFLCTNTFICGYHNFFGSNTIYAAVPYAASFACTFGANPNNNDADPTINVASHEQMEAVTDPLLNAWSDSNGAEIGDKCNSNFGPLDGSGGDVAWNGHEYFVQEEWDNNTSGCSLVSSMATHNLPGTWPQCASENSTCSFNGTLTVAYGANGKYFYRALTNGTACNNSIFGDPNVGTVKACYLEPSPPVSNVWTQCSAENGVCSFTGILTVAYGANGKFNYLTVNSGTPCNNSVFGDPNFGTAKACYLMGPPPNTTSWIFCLNSPCSFDNTQEVAYGADGQFFYRTLTNGTACNNTVFGGDPAPVLGKACYYQ